jgi:uncharacterized protein (TIGR03083 family)
MRADAAAVIDELEETWRSMSDACVDLSPDQWALPTDCPGWDVKDHLSHILGFERVLSGQQGTMHRADPKPWVRNQIGEFNEHEVDARRAESGDDVRSEFDQITADRLAQLRAMPDDAFDADSWTPIGPGKLLDLLQIRLLDSYVHEQDMRRALDRPGHLTGPAAERTVDRMFRTLPATFGKRAGAPEGASLVVDLTGPVERHAALAVQDGRAQRLDDDPADPTVTLTTTSDAFLRLAAGRAEPGTVPVHVTGDQALGEAVLGHLNQMI